MNHIELKLAWQFQILYLPFLGTTMNQTIRLEKILQPKSSKEKKWLQVYGIES